MAIDRASPDEIFLNALVDGELAPGERAAAAARLANDREFARAYATLTRLKASVIESAEAVPPVHVQLPPAKSRRMAVAIGASAGLAAVVAIAFFTATLSPKKEIAATARPAKESVRLAAFPGEPVIPNLAPAGLRLAGTTVNSDAKLPILVATYLGPRGCRLELRVRAADTDAMPAGGTDRRSWRVGGLAYELIAYGMPAARFTAVAEAAEKATRATGLPDRINGRLREARASAPPCLS